MTLKEKQEYIDNFCDDTFDVEGNGCEGCPFDYDTAWCHVGCAFDIKEDEVDAVLAKIQPKTGVTLGMAVEKVVTDMINHPSHYTQGDIECIDAMLSAYGKDAVSIWCLLNAFKYLWRTEHKNGSEDLDKAIWYLKKRLELLGNE